MSYDRGLKTVRLEMIDKPAQAESISHPAWIHSRAREGESFEETFLRLIEEYDLDIVVGIPQNNIILGTAYEPIPGATEDSIYRFDPFNPPADYDIDYVKNLGVHPSASIDEMASHFYKEWRRTQDKIGDRALVPAAWYHLVVHYFSTTFGWEATFYAAYTQPSLFLEVADKFKELTIKVLTAWAQTGIKYMICHDDIAMVDRTIFPPEWYREVVYPRYNEIFRPLTNANIPFMFMSDGKIDDLVPDIVKLGPSGFFMDDMVNFDRIAGEVGDSRFLMGNVKVGTLTLGDKSDIGEEIERVYKTGKRCKNHIIHCSGGIMHNIPVENVDFYFNKVRELRNQ